MPVRRRRFRWIVLAILVVLGGAWLGRGWWLEPWIARRVAAALSDTLGGPVTIAQVSGSWWRQVTVSGVAATELTATPLRTLHLEQVEASYGLGIITGNLQHLRTLTVRGAEVEIDLRQRPPSAPSETWAPFLASVPQPLPEIRIDGRWLLRLDAGDISCAGVAIIAGGQRLALAATGVQVPWLTGTRDFELVLRIGAEGQLELTEPLELAGLANVDALTLRADDEAQGFSLTAGIADGQVAVAVKPNAWSVTLERIALDHLPSDLPWTVPSTLEGRVSARLRGGTGPLHIAVDVEDVAWSPLRLAKGHAEGTWHLGKLTIPTVNLDSGDGIRVHGRDIRISADGARQGTVHVDAEDLRPLLRRLNVVTTLPNDALSAQIHARADGTGVRIDALTVQAPGQELIGTGSWSGPDAHEWQLEGSLRSDLASLSPYLPEVAPLAGTLSGDLTVSGVGGDIDQIDLAFTGSGQELILSGLSVPTCTVELRGRDRRLDVDALAIIRDTVLALNGTAAVAEDGTITAIIPGLAVARGEVVVSNTDTIHARWKAPHWAVEPAHFSGLGGQLVLGGSGSNNQIELAVRAEDVDLTVARQLGITHDVQGRIDVAMTMDGAIAHPELSLRVATRGLAVAGVPGQVAIALRQDADGIHIEEAWMTAAQMAEVRITGVWPLRLGRDGFTATGTMGSGATLTTTIASLDRWFGNLFTSGSLACTASVVPDAQGRPELRALLAVTDARVALADPFALVRQRAEPPPIDVQVELRADIQRGQMHLTADINDTTCLRGDLMADWQHGFSQAPLSGHLRFDDLDLQSFATISSQIVRLQGTLSGELRIGGTIGEPEPQGQLHVSEGELKMNANVPTIVAIHGQLEVIDANALTFGLTAEMGYAPVGLTGSLKGIDGKPHVDISVTAEDALLIQNRDLRIHATTTDLRLHGPLTALRSEGTIIINDGLWSRPIDLIGTGASRASVEDGRLELFSLREPPLSNMVFDLRIRTNPNRTGLRLSNNLINADLRVDLHLGGTGRSPEPNGFIISQDARVSLPFSILTIERAELAFPDGDPFRPTLDLTGTSQVRQWRIAVQARGPIDDIVIQASAPGVSTEDALMLLTTGATRNELTNTDGQRAMLSRVGTFVGMELVRTIRGPSDPDASDTLLDRWSLDFGREISRDGRETIDAEIRLNPFAQRHGWLLYGQRDRYDEYNIGVTLRLRLGGKAP